MSPDTSASPKPVARVEISCPGCGRHDWVRWSETSAVFHWKCFNCGKEFDLTRKGAR